MDGEQRLRFLIERNREMIEHCYVTGKERTPSPAIMVLDLADARAKALAVAWAGEDVVAGQIKKSRKKNNDPSLIRSFSLQDVCNNLQRWGELQAIQDLRNCQASGTIPCVVVALGGVGVVSGIGIPD